MYNKHAMTFLERYILSELELHAEGIVNDTEGVDASAWDRAECAVIYANALESIIGRICHDEESIAQAITHEIESGSFVADICEKYRIKAIQSEDEDEESGFEKARAYRLFPNN